MNRRVGAAVAAVAVIVLACTPEAGTMGPSQAAPPAPTPPTANPSESMAPSATPASAWTPGATVTLGTASAAPIGDFVATRLAATPAGFALIGQDGSQAPLFVAGSVDGGSWSRLDVTALGSDLNDLAAGARGVVLAARDSSGDAGHLWFSSDGLTWGRVDQPAELTNVAVSGLFTGGAGFALAGGEGPAGRPVVWTSADGHDWQEATALRGVGIASLAVLDGAYVAIEPPDTQPGIRVSADGIAWKAVPTADLGPINVDEELIAAAGSNLVVVRSAGPDGGVEAWSGSVDPSAGTIDWRQAPDAGFSKADFVSLAVAGRSATLVGYDRSMLTAVAWTTADGRTWTRHDLAGAFGGGAPSIIAASGTTLAGLGWTSDAESREIRQLWRSADGAAWSPVTSDLFGTLPPLARNQCPSSRPTSASQLVAVAGVLSPFCFGNQPITVTGYVVDCGGCGGTSPWIGSPSWLLDPVGFSRFWLSSSASGNSTNGVGVDVDPAHPIKIPAFGREVRITGHFADPAASTCRLYPSPGSGAELPPPAQAILQCREEFVATGITILK